MSPTSSSIYKPILVAMSVSFMCMDASVCCVLQLVFINDNIVLEIKVNRGQVHV